MHEVFYGIIREVSRLREHLIQQEVKYEKIGMYYRFNRNACYAYADKRGSKR